MKIQTVRDIAYAILGVFLVVCFTVVILAGLASIAEVLLRWVQE